MQHKVYPYRKVIGPPVKATNTTVRYPLVCGHMAVRPTTAPVPLKARCEQCQPTTTIGV